MSRSFAKTDSMTGVDTVITYEHHEIHGGSFFATGAADLAMGDTETLILAFKTPAGTKRIHLLMGYQTLVGGNLALHEGATWDVSTGTQNPIYNHLRQTTMASSILLESTGGSFVASDNVALNPTNFSAGTIIHHFYAFGDKGKVAGGGSRGTEEVILKPDTTYAVVFTADGASNKAHVTLDWYEHTDA